METLFDYKGDDCHLIYKSIRDGDSAHVQFVRENVDKQWQQYHPYADPHFKREFRISPDQRYWEMYLGCCFLDRGIEITSQAEGPDFGFKINGKQVWVEAIAPSVGNDDNPDRVPDLILLSEGGTAQQAPREKIILRYTAAFQEKEKKFAAYTKKGIVADGDVKIIAISSSSIRGWGHSGTQPYILSALFPIGNPYITIDRRTLKTVGQGHTFQPSVKRESGAEIETMSFISPEHKTISAVIYGSSDIGNPPKRRGDDIILIHNPITESPLLHETLKFDAEYWAEDADEERWELKHKEFKEADVEV